MKYDYSKKSWEKGADMDNGNEKRYLRYVLIVIIIVIAAIVVWSLSGSSPKKNQYKTPTRAAVTKANPHKTVKKTSKYTTTPLKLPQ